MQLREILPRYIRLWPLLALPLLTALFSLVGELQRPPLFQATSRLMLSQAPLATSPQSEMPDINLNYSWNSSTYLLDDVPQVIGSHLFAEDVAALLRDRGHMVDPTEIQLSASVLHRSVAIAATSRDPNLAPLLVEGAIAAFQAHGMKYWGRTLPTTNGLLVVVLDPPSQANPVGGLRDLLLNVGLRTALSLAAVVGFVLVVGYLDDRLRSARQAEAWIGATVIGLIPPEKK